MNGPLGSSLDLSVADVTFTEERSGSSSYAGGTVSGAGDLDADGLGDFLFGASNWWDEKGTSHGAAFLFLGGGY